MCSLGNKTQYQANNFLGLNFGKTGCLTCLWKTRLRLQKCSGKCLFSVWSFSLRSLLCCDLQNPTAALNFSRSHLPVSIMKLKVISAISAPVYVYVVVTWKSGPNWCFQKLCNCIYFLSLKLLASKTFWEINNVHTTRWYQADKQ